MINQQNQSDSFHFDSPVNSNTYEEEQFSNQIESAQLDPDESIIFQETDTVEETVTFEYEFKDQERFEIINFMYGKDIRIKMQNLGVIGSTIIENSDPPKMKIIMNGRGDNYIQLYNFLEDMQHTTKISKMNFNKDPSTKESVLKCQAIREIMNRLQARISSLNYQIRRNIAQKQGFYTITVTCGESTHNQVKKICVSLERTYLGLTFYFGNLSFKHPSAQNVQSTLSELRMKYFEHNLQQQIIGLFRDHNILVSQMLQNQKQPYYFSMNFLKKKKGNDFLKVNYKVYEIIKLTLRGLVTIQLVVDMQDIDENKLESFYQIFVDAFRQKPEVQLKQKNKKNGRYQKFVLLGEMGIIIKVLEDIQSEQQAQVNNSALSQVEIKLKKNFFEFIKFDSPKQGQRAIEIIDNPKIQQASRNQESKFIDSLEQLKHQISFRKLQDNSICIKPNKLNARQFTKIIIHAIKCRKMLNNSFETEIENGVSDLKSQMSKYIDLDNQCKPWNVLIKEFESKPNIRQVEEQNSLSLYEDEFDGGASQTESQDRNFNSQSESSLNFNHQLESRQQNQQQNDSQNQRNHQTQQRQPQLQGLQNGSQSGDNLSWKRKLIPSFPPGLDKYFENPPHGERLCFYEILPVNIKLETQDKSDWKPTSLYTLQTEFYKSPNEAFSLFSEGDAYLMVLKADPSKMSCIGDNLYRQIQPKHAIPWIIIERE